MSIHGYLDGYRHSWANGLIGEFFFSPPLQAYCLIRECQRYDSGVCCRIVRSVMTIATRTVTVTTDDLLRIKFQHLRDVSPQWVHALPVRPDHHGLAIITRYRG